jgi:hypothetical protein
VCSEKAAEKVYLCAFSEQEYRAYEGMQLGEDIDMIATDTIEHQHIIMTFLKENNIDNIEVVLIKQLEQSLTDHKRPENIVANTTLMASPAAMNAVGTSSVAILAAQVTPADLTGLTNESLAPISNSSASFK